MAIRRAGGLVDSTDLASLWGCGRQYAHRQTQRTGFPEPVKVSGRVKLYLSGEVAEWRAHA